MTAASATERYSIDCYKYVCTPGTEEWNDCKSVAERVEKNIIPDSIITKMTTTALVQAFLDYPFSIDILLFSSPEQGYENMKDSSNILQELERRDDAFSAVYNLYTQTEDEEIIEKTQLEIIMLYGNFQLNDEEKDCKASIFSNGNAYLFLSFPDLVNEEKIQSLRLQYPQTPSGNDVTHSWCFYDQEEMDPLFIGLYEEEIADAYGLYPDNNCPATLKYNCHSYAWYSQYVSGNKWWIMYPNDYISDPFYSVSMNISAGNKVSYRVKYSGEYKHSGIVLSVGNGTGPNILVRSKWGSAGLYTHSIYNCPAEYGTICSFYTH